MNKFINTESIFSTIGNYPVVDQFDILYSGLLSGSTVDSYITGSLFYRTKNADNTTYTTNRGERGFVFSKTGVNRDSTPGITNDIKDSYGLQPWWERAGIVRNLKIFSESERFADTLLPNLSEMINTLGGSLLWTTDEPPPYMSVRIMQVADPADPPNLYPYVADGFTESFPFEPKFSLLNKTKNLSESFVSKIEYQGGDVYVATSAKRSKNLVPGDSVGWYGIVDGSISGITGPVEEELTKIFFGFGDRIARIQSRIAPGTYYMSNNLASFRYAPYAGSAINPIIRGWKYGLIDGNPRYTSVIFRRDRFGQFRDMLEQRIDTKFIVDKINSPNFNYGSFETPAIPTTLSSFQEKTKEGELILPVVSIRFIKKTLQITNINGSEINQIIDTPVSPLETQSSNVDTYATSSLPYFDGVSTNRPEINYSQLNVFAI